MEVKELLKSRYKLDGIIPGMVEVGACRIYLEVTLSSSALLHNFLEGASSKSVGTCAKGP